jgi:hypothetical protein
MPRIPKPEPTQEQLQALREFAKKYGRNWKQELSDMWLAGRDANEPNGHLLRQVRNQCGPSWLAKFKL